MLVRIPPSLPQLTTDTCLRAHSTSRRRDRPISSDSAQGSDAGAATAPRHFVNQWHGLPAGPARILVSTTSSIIAINKVSFPLYRLDRQVLQYLLFQCLLCLHLTTLSWSAVLHYSNWTPPDMFGLDWRDSFVLPRLPSEINSRGNHLLREIDPDFCQAHERRLMFRSYYPPGPSRLSSIFPPAAQCSTRQPRARGTSRCRSWPCRCRRTRG